ncbi:hypothetical protein [Streptomyces lannensis]|uniref:hypothetical protein n=1 Tax=Streptomyces lannensis TaxID=766498 RepID=UPI0031EFA57A
MAHLTGSSLGIWPGRASSLPPDRLFDLTRSAVTAAGLLAGIFAVVYSYRKQKIEEATSRRADADSLGTRYQDASGQLGNESATVRLAGIYALSRLADEDSTQRETVCRLLCGYLRMPYDPVGPPAGEREVRHTVIKVIAEHLQDPTSDFSWCGYDLDFSGAVFDGGSFAGSHFVGSYINFSGCRFVNGKVLFDRSTLEDAHVDFGDGESMPAFFDGGAVHFIGAHFKAGAHLTFIFTQFKSGALEFGTSYFLPGSVVTFSSCDIGGAIVSFGGPVWGGAHFLGGSVSFDGADLKAGLLSFMGTSFSGSHVSLDEITQTGTAIFFDAASFGSGKVTFNNAKLSNGEISFGLGADPEAVVSPWPLSRPVRRRGGAARRLYGWVSGSGAARTTRDPNPD